jgi:hypothetical protein
MNRVKYRPVGKPGPIVEVKVSQSKAAIHPPPGGRPRPSVAKANRHMDARGYVRAGVRHG